MANNRQHNAPSALDSQQVARVCGGALDKIIMQMPIIFIALLMAPVYAGIFVLILQRVGVVYDLGKRSWILGATFAGVELCFNFVGSSSAATVLTIFVFIFLLSYLLVLKLWQAIGIPVLVAVVGTLIRIIFEYIFAMGAGMLWFFGYIR